jgi:hypothetical protein
VQGRFRCHSRLLRLCWAVAHGRVRLCNRRATVENGPNQFDDCRFLVPQAELKLLAVLFWDSCAVKCPSMTRRVIAVASPGKVAQGAYPQQ